MKNILKSGYISFLLALLMVVGVFLPHGGALAKDAEKKADKYTIDLQIDVKDQDDYSKHDFKKDSLIIRSSGRQVKIYKLNNTENLTDDQMIELANKYNEYTDEDIKKLRDDKKIDEGILSEKSKLKYGDDNNLYDEIDTSKIKDFDYSKLSEHILIPNLEQGYYLIKETAESAKILKEKLATNVVKLPNDNVKDGKFIIIAKEVKPNNNKDIRLIKEDADNKDIRINQVEFQLYKKTEEGKDDELVKLTGQNGVYYRDDENGAAITLKTWKNGELVVRNLLEGTYYFKEKTPHPGYDKSNIGQPSEDVSPGGTVTVKNKITPILRKIDATDKNKYLKDAVFKLYKKDGTVLKFKKTGVYYEQDVNGKEEIVTDANGAIYISDLKDGEYYLEETKAPDKYKATDKKIEFKVKDSRVIDDKGNIRVLPIENTPLIPAPPTTPTGGYNFVKIDSTNDKKRLGGAKFILMKKVGDSYDKVLVEGKEVKLTSKDNGEFSIAGLEYGEYALKEIEAPKNHFITKELTPFTVDAASSSLPAEEIVNEPYVPSVVTSRSNTITTKYTPSDVTRIVKSPLVKTGDIRIVIMAVVGFILLLMGIKLVNSGERIQRV